MVRIYRPINDTWTISRKTLDGFEERTKFLEIAKPNTVRKFGVVLTNIRYMFRFGYYGGTYGLEFFIYSSNVTATICVTFKNSGIKHNFINITCRSEMFSLPYHMFYSNKKFIADRNCEIEIEGMFVIERDEYPSIPRLMCQENVSELWESNDKDFDIIVAGSDEEAEVKIQIHKKVLRVQSPVFEAMLNSGMKEATTNTLKIIDFNFETIITAVEYFYGHEINDFISIEDIFELIRFADKYVIDDLLAYISTFISYRLSPINVFTIINYANASPYFDEELKKLCYYILNLSSVSIDSNLL